MFETIIYEKQEGIAIIKINRPEVLNSLNLKMLEELNAVLDIAATDDEVHLIIITGEGRAFIVGADIEEMRSQNQLEANDFSAFGAAVMRKIEKLAKPSIAACNGFTLGGGCELAMACDMRIASSKAKFGQPEVGLGIIPGFSGTQRLPRLIGKAKAIELILTGDIINAETAYQLGLVNKVTAPEDLMDEVMALAGRIMKNGPRAVRYANRAIKRGYDTDLETGINIETSFFGLCFATLDQKEGMTAFIEKRKPNFQGK